MNLKENKIRTDQAWNKLYNRIEKDGLLCTGDTHEHGLAKSVTFRWVAGIAIICICSVIGLMVFNTRQDNKELLTLQNNEANTLVTTLEDGTIVYLTEQASLSYPKHFEDKKREVFFQGDAFFDINKNPNRPFIIETNIAKIEVLGTAFNIKISDGNSFSLSVLRGEVRVTSKKTGKSSNIKPGQSVTVKDREMKLDDKPADDFNNYTRHIHFKDQRLSDIINVINSNSDSLKIELNTELENRRMTVTFVDETPLSMAKLICIALNLDYKQERETIQLFAPK